jgi:hypothetical protein
MTGKRLYLHIGARKTGSSMLQTMFARNAGSFLKQGLYYPIEDEQRAHAAQGFTTSGNGGLLMQTLRPDVAARAPYRGKGDEAFLELVERSPCGRILISSEFLCAARSESLERFRALVQSAGAEVEFIYFVRNPLDHAFSEWTQRIKAGTITREWREYLRRYILPFEGVIRRFAEHFGGTMRVLNYDYYRSDLLKAVCDILAVVPTAAPGDLRVNRSPTKAEAELLLYINKFISENRATLRNRAALMRRIYKQLIMRPVSERMRPLVSGDDLEVFERNNAKGLAYVNQFVSGAPLSLHEGEVQRGELVLGPPPQEMRFMLDVILGAVIDIQTKEWLQERRSRRAQEHRGKQPGESGVAR